MNPLLDILTQISAPANAAGTAAPSAPTGVVPEGLFALALNAAVQQSILPVNVDGTTAALLTPALAEPAIVSEKPQSPTEVDPQPLSTVPQAEPVVVNATVCADQPLLALFGPKTTSALPDTLPTQPYPPAQPNALVADIVTPLADQQLAAVLVETLGQSAQVPSQTAVAITLPSTVDVNVDQPISTQELVAVLTRQTPPADTEVASSDAPHVGRFTVDAQPAAIHQLKSQLQQQYPELRIQSLDGHLQADATVRLQPETTAVTPTVQPAVADIAALPLPLRGHPVVNFAGHKRSGQPSTQPVSMAGPQPPTSEVEGKTVVPQPAQTSPSQTNPKPLTATEASRLSEPLKQDSPVSTGTGQSAFAAVDKMPVDNNGQMSKAPAIEIPDTERVHVSVKRVQIETLIKRGEIKLQLQPEHLGTVRVRLVTTPHETSARLETSSEEARRMVEVNLPQLRESFERAGLKLNQIEVVVSDDALSRHSQAFARQPRQPRRQFIPAAVADGPAAATVTAGLTALVNGLNLLA